MRTARTTTSRGSLCLICDMREDVNGETVTVYGASDYAVAAGDSRCSICDPFLWALVVLAIFAAAIVGDQADELIRRMQHLPRWHLPR